VLGHPRVWRGGLLGRTGWSSGGGRGAGASATQDGGRGDQQSAAPASGEQAGDGGDHGAVAPTDLWSWCAALQDGQLMAQHEDLDLVGGVGAGWSTILLSNFVNTW
jgi:hypothetical protein